MWKPQCSCGVTCAAKRSAAVSRFNQFRRTAQWALDAGAKRLLVQPQLDLGRGSHIPSQRLTSAQLNLLILQTTDFASYFDNGYAAFDRLRRATFDEYVADWPDVILPWYQLLADRSRADLLPASRPAVQHGCGGRSVEPIFIAGKTALTTSASAA